MEQRILGRDGPPVPVIGFGAWPIGGGMGAVDEADAVRTVHHALDHGVTLIDTAEAYRSSEATLGKALHSWTGTRDQLFLATKVRGNDLSREHVERAIGESLRQLRTDYVDLLQAHSWDAGHPIEETMRAFEDLTRSGKVRYTGVSNFDVPQMEAARAAGAVQSLQPAYSLLARGVEAEILPYCQAQGIGVLAHSPLAKGLLTGKYTPQSVFPADDERARMPRFSGAEGQRNLATAGRLQAWAAARGHTLVELAIAWVLSNPAVTVCLCGAKSPQQVDDHVRAAAWRLSAAERAEIDALLAAEREGGA
jgi:aryl-alcohol dehydrogenase-like predicted oxidoreductase